MNHYIQIALIFWTLSFCINRFQWALICRREGEPWAPNTILSSLSLITALLAVGQYIN